MKAADRAAGYRYRLSLMQVEVADTRVFDRPLRGRQWFEATIRDQLSLAGPVRWRLHVQPNGCRSPEGAVNRRLLGLPELSRPQHVRTDDEPNGNDPEMEYELDHREKRPVHDAVDVRDAEIGRASCRERV